jgi:hypothetical protein
VGREAITILMMAKKIVRAEINFKTCIVVVNSERGDDGDFFDDSIGGFWGPGGWKYIHRFGQTEPRSQEAEKPRSQEAKRTSGMRVPISRGCGTFVRPSIRDHATDGAEDSEVRNHMPG